MPFPALQSRDFRIYEIGGVFSVNAQWINRVVIGWIAWDLTHSATWVGLMSFFLFAPTVVSSPLFGVLMDRVDLRRAALVSNGIVTAGALALYLLDLAGILNIWGLSVVALVIGFAGSAERAVRVTLVPRMVERHAVPNAVSIHAANFNIGRLVGPAIGGTLIETTGTGTTMLINVLIFIPYLAALFLLSVRKREGAAAERKPFLVELWHGARYAITHPIIREALLLTCVTSLTVRGVNEIVPAIADGVYQRGAEGLGQMLAVGGAGAFIAAFANSLRQAKAWDDGIPTVAHVAVFFGLVSVSSLGAANNWYLALAFVGATGFAGTMIGINMQSAIQLTVDDGFRGRVMSLWMVVGLGTSSLGALLLGALTDAFGISTTLIGAGFAGIAAVVALRTLLARSGRD